MHRGGVGRQVALSARFISNGSNTPQCAVAWCVRVGVWACGRVGGWVRLLATIGASDDNYTSRLTTITFP
jgi:hypothetical protein